MSTTVKILVPTAALAAAAAIAGGALVARSGPAPVAPASIAAVVGVGKPTDAPSADRRSADAIERTAERLRGDEQDAGHRAQVARNLGEGRL